MQMFVRKDFFAVLPFFLFFSFFFCTMLHIVMGASRPSLLAEQENAKSALASFDPMGGRDAQSVRGVKIQIARVPFSGGH